MTRCRSNRRAAALPAKLAGRRANGRGRARRCAVGADRRVPTARHECRAAASLTKKRSSSVAAQPTKPCNLKDGPAVPPSLAVRPPDEDSSHESKRSPRGRHRDAPTGGTSPPRFANGLPVMGRTHQQRPRLTQRRSQPPSVGNVRARAMRRDESSAHCRALGTCGFGSLRTHPGENPVDRALPVRHKSCVAVAMSRATTRVVLRPEVQRVIAMMSARLWIPKS